MGSKPSGDGLCSLSTILEKSLKYLSSPLGSVLLKQLISLDTRLVRDSWHVCLLDLVGRCPQQAKQSFQKVISKKLLELGS